MVVVALNTHQVAFTAAQNERLTAGLGSGDVSGGPMGLGVRYQFSPPPDTHTLVGA